MDRVQLEDLMNTPLK